MSLAHRHFIHQSGMVKRNFYTLRNFPLQLKYVRILTVAFRLSGLILGLIAFTGT